MKIENSLREKIRKAFSPLHLEIENESHMHSRGGPETHFKILVVSEKFEGMLRVDRQRAVMSLFEEERALGLHALSLRVLSEKEWETQKAQEFFSPICQTKKN